MKRCEIIVTGDVQEAGYRAFVRKIAQKLGLVGYVENLPDGTVNIVCEGLEDKIRLFCEQIKIQTATINVENIDIRFKDATGEFNGKGFKVKIADIAEELFQGYATAAKYFMIGFEKQDRMLEKQDKMLEKQDETLKAINSMHKDLNAMHKDMVDCFFHLDEKYGKFDIRMSNIETEMREIKELFAKLVKYFIHRNENQT